MAYDVTAPVVTQVDDGDVSETGTVPTCSISAPDAVFAMLAEADLHPGQRVLEIGAGTGYNAALLERRVGAGSSSRPGKATSAPMDWFASPSPTARRPDPS
jgi:protein-L-isoaspartate O-methyltransferase